LNFDDNVIIRRPMSTKAIRRIKTLYYDTTKSSIEKDLSEAIELFKTFQEESDRESVAVYMDGLSQMRSEWRIEKVRVREKAQRMRLKEQSARPQKRKGRPRNK
jgi:phosphate starvation-inducible protein PhoH